MSEQNWKTAGFDPSKNGWWKASLGEEVSNFGYPNSYLFADSARAIIQAFGKHFSNIWVCHYDEDGYPRKKIRVPIKFGPRSKAYDFRKAQEMKDKTGREYYIPLPNMTFKITGGSYDSTRAASMGGIRYFYDTYFTSKGVEEKQLDLLWRDTVPVPQNIQIELTANCETYSDAMQIWEQIAGQFAPDINLRVKEFWFSDIPRDLKVVMDSYNFNFTEDYGEDAKREMSITFSFKVEAVIYTGVQDATIIDQIRLILDPSIAQVSNQKDYYCTFSGDIQGNVYIPTTDPGESNRSRYYIPASISASIIEPNGDCYRIKAEAWENNTLTSALVPIYDSPLAERMESASNYYIQYQYASAYCDTVQSPYKSYYNLSGNYKPQEGTYNSATYDWQASRTDRYPIDNMKSWQTSAEKDVFIDNEVIRGITVSESYNSKGKTF